MKLSVVIVNYNVEYFLDQCLSSVEQACKGIDAEVFVVDNASSDGSLEMLRQKHPSVKLIANKDNVGFSKANNQAIVQSTGEYVLLLNPDTVVEEDTFSHCIEFMDARPDAGACGVKLIDGKGNFLPESKRGLPTPAVSFYKISGLSKLFPKSKRFGKYHLGYLDAESVQEIDVLSGAFMFIRREALNKAGLLDEAFFMYGEDIDLSYRITQAGYKIFYTPGTRTIHYRGESTKKGSANYVYVFYNAMAIFANKHFSAKYAQTFNWMIKLAIVLRALVSLFRRVAGKIALPLFDALVIFAGMHLLKTYWAGVSGIYYPYAFMWIAVPLYIIAWLGGVYISGGYDKPIRLYKIARGLIIGTVLILVVYALLEESYRFSRFLTIMGAFWAAVSMFFSRIAINLLIKRKVLDDEQESRRILVAGSIDECNRVAQLINQSPVKVSYIAYLNPKASNKDSFYIGSINEIAVLSNVFSINEIIFCASDLSAEQIMDLMMQTSDAGLEYKIAPPESLYIIGSNSIDEPGELYVVGLNSIDKPGNRRKKRIFDVLFSSAVIVMFPFYVFLIEKPFDIFTKAFSILFSSRFSWVGYSPQISAEDLLHLPKIKLGIFHPLSAFQQAVTDPKIILQANMLYAKDYKISNDLEIILKSLFNK
ncbi:MAG: glycosyltransferase family 2 protein [Flavobacteriales bacterium]